MSKSKELAKNTIIILLGTICTKLISFFLLPLYTGILSTSDYGFVDLINTIITLITPIIGLRISLGTYRFLIDNRKNEENQKKIISSSLFFILVSLILYLIIFVSIYKYIHINYKIFLITNVISSIILDFLMHISRGFGDNKTYSISSVLTALFTILFNIYFLLVLKMRVNGILIGTLIGQIIGILYLTFSLKIYRFVSIKLFDKVMLKKLLKYSMPMVPNQLSWWVFNASDRIIVTWILGVSFTGILSVSYKFSGLLITIYNIFNISWTESMALHIKDEDIVSFFNNTFEALFNFFSAFSLLLIGFMPIIFRFMINSKFNYAYNLIPIPIIASLCQVVVGLVSAVYVAKNDTKAIANTSFVAAIINIVVHFLLIKFIGLYAAVISTFVSYFVFAIYRSYDINKKYIKLKYDIKKLLLSITTLILILIGYYYNSIISNIFIMFTSVVYAILINKNTFNSMKTIILKKVKRSV